ncbi:MAG TPA: MarR family winged helix-turn-helix transcriptional regulator [Candidatus Saccharimonadales bacterium]|jgi:DNA-binding MarR family transcriptional regulator
MEHFELTLELYRTTSIMDAYIDANLVPAAGISRAQFTIIFMVNRFPDSTQAELARKLSRSHVAVGRLVAILTERGYVQQHTSPRNAHAHCLTTTKAGNALIKKVGRLFEQKSAELFTNAPDQLDEATLHEQLKLLSDRIIAAR